MKKLSKLKLKEFREMSDSEMKNVLGGFYDPFDKEEKIVCKDGSIYKA